MYMRSCINYLAILGDRYKGASFNYFDKILAFSTTYLPRWHLRRNSFIIEGQISLLLTIPVPPTVLRLVNVVCERPPSCRLDIIYVAIEICHIRAISIICTYITKGNIKVSTSPRNLVTTYLVFLSRYRTRAIISRGLYIFYHILKDHFFVFKEVFSENSVLMYGLYSR